jgi:hypothetical protein
MMKSFYDVENNAKNGGKLGCLNLLYCSRCCHSQSMHQLWSFIVLTTLMREVAL